MFIAVETSTDIASASLYKDQTIKTLQSENVASQVILPMLQRLLTENEVNLKECKALVFGCGPGSFTGVRTACGVAKGLALGTRLPLIAVSGLLAMAETCRQREGYTDVLTIIDARMREVYWAQYRYEQNAWTTVIEPRVSTPQEVQPIDHPVACGNGLSVYEKTFLKLPVLKKITAIMPNSEAMVQLAPYLYEQGQFTTDANPLYLRNKVAYTTKERDAMKEIAC